MFKSTVAIVVLSFILISCASTERMEGAYRGPEKFGKDQYETVSPAVDLTKKVRVVLLTFRDERPKHPGLDWTRQANIHADSIGQPVEVRPEIEKAIVSGMKKHSKITLIPSATFLKNREADIVISGKILKCEAQRGARNFGAQTVIEITVRDEFGTLFWKTPIRIQGLGKADYRDTGFFDEIDPGRVGAALTDSIEAAANDLLQKVWFTQALSRAQEGPDRELASEDFRARAE